MRASQVIVLERDGQWTAALRQELGHARPRNLYPDSSPASHEAVRVIEIRSWDEIWQQLAQDPAALVAAELTDTNRDSVLAALSRMDRQFPQAAMLILTNRRFLPYRRLLREAGALHYVTSPRRLDEVVEIVLRRCARLPVATTSAGRRDEILADLPWTDAVE
jgi:DNA-binding NarL/FixJ family response regulator